MFLLFSALTLFPAVFEKLDRATAAPDPGKCLAGVFKDLGANSMKFWNIKLPHGNVWTQQTHCCERKTNLCIFVFSSPPPWDPFLWPPSPLHSWLLLNFSGIILDRNKLIFWRKKIPLILLKFHFWLYGIIFSFWQILSTWDSTAFSGTVWKRQPCSPTCTDNELDFVLVMRTQLLLWLHTQGLENY